MNQPFGEMSKSLCTTYLCSILNPNNYIQLLSLTQHPKWYRIIHILHISQIKVKLFSSQTVSLLPGGCAICNLKTQLARNRTCCRCKMVRGCKLTPWNSPLNWPHTSQPSWASHQEMDSIKSSKNYLLVI